MLLKKYLAPFVVVAALASPAVAQKAAEPAQAAVEAAADPNGSQHVIPSLKLEQSTIEELVEKLQAEEPRFRAVVIRDAGVPREYPSITMNLRQVSIDQILQVLTNAYQGVEMHQIDGPNGALHMIKIVAAEQQPGEPPANQIQHANATAVRVHRLAPIVDSLAAQNGGAQRKDSLAQVLSLVKAALVLDETGVRAPTIQVHEETMTLLVKGTDSQHSTIEKVLMVLQPPPKDLNAATAEMKIRMMEVESEMVNREKLAEIMHATLKERLSAAERESHEVRKRLADREEELNRLKAAINSDNAAGIAPGHPKSAVGELQRSQPK